MLQCQLSGENSSFTCGQNVWKILDAACDSSSAHRVPVPHYERPSNLPVYPFQHTLWWWNNFGPWVRLRFKWPVHIVVVIFMSSLTPQPKQAPPVTDSSPCPRLNSFVLSAGLVPPYLRAVWAEVGTPDIHRELLKEEDIWGLGSIGILVGNVAPPMGLNICHDS